MTTKNIGLKLYGGGGRVEIPSDWIDASGVLVEFITTWSNGSTPSDKSQLNFSAWLDGSVNPSDHIIHSETDPGSGTADLEIWFELNDPNLTVTGIYINETLIPDSGYSIDDPPEYIDINPDTFVHGNTDTTANIYVHWSDGTITYVGNFIIKAEGS